jgi:hypothetical protein
LSDRMGDRPSERARASSLRSELASRAQPSYVHRSIVHVCNLGLLGTLTIFATITVNHSNVSPSDHIIVNIDLVVAETEQTVILRSAPGPHKHRYLHPDTSNNRDLAIDVHGSRIGSVHNVYIDVATSTKRCRSTGSLNDRPLVTLS